MHVQKIILRIRNIQINKKPRMEKIGKENVKMAKKLKEEGYALKVSVPIIGLHDKNHEQRNTTSRKRSILKPSNAKCYNDN